MTRTMAATILSVLLLGAACGGGGGGGSGHPLQSSCVQEHVNIYRYLEDGSGCVNFGAPSCENEYASDCINYCAFGMCQPGPCETSLDCPQYFTCEAYVWEGRNFGTWCNYRY
jgi:hypothetical protein